MKKRYISCVILLSACLLSGCASGIELTEEENNMVAEYMAGALLKYNKGYEGALLEVNSSEEIEEEKDVTVKDTNDENTDTKKEQEKSPSNLDKDNNKPASTNSNSNEKKEISSSVSDLFASKQYSLSYKSSNICSSYPEEGNGYFTVEAVSGKKLAVIHLAVKNVSGKKQTVDLAKEGIGYSLDLNGKTYKESLLTLATNDVHYFSDTIEAGKSRDAVLVFEVDKKDSLSNGNLVISSGSSTATIKLK